eukprot:tig00000944_g5949.t1
MRRSVSPTLGPSASAPSLLGGHSIYSPFRSTSRRFPEDQGSSSSLRTGQPGRAASSLRAAADTPGPGAYSCPPLVAVPQRKPKPRARRDNGSKLAGTLTLERREALLSKDRFQLDSYEYKGLQMLRKAGEMDSNSFTTEEVRMTVGETMRDKNWHRNRFDSRVPRFPSQRSWVPGSVGPGKYGALGESVKVYMPDRASPMMRSTSARGFL